MRKNIISKILAYAILMISGFVFIFGIIFSIFEYEANEKKEREKNRDDFQFYSYYMDEMAGYARELIYNNKNYTQVEDNGKTICYLYDYGYRWADYQIKDLYFLITYKDKAFTNVELTTETRTIDEIKNYISQKESKKTNIINGKVFSDTDCINKKAIQYFDSFDFNYYKTIPKIVSNTDYEEENTEEFGELVVEPYVAKINDFEIYSTYKEEIIDINSKYKVVEQIFAPFEKYSELIYISIPISTIVAILVLLYIVFLCDNDKEKVKLNFFDKMWFEVIFLVSLIIMGCFLAFFVEGFYDFIDVINIKYIFVTGYIIFYVIFALMFNTFLKRIKLKEFWNTTITGKIVKFILKNMNKIKAVALGYYKKINKLIPRRGRILIIIFGFLTIQILLIMMFSFLGYLLDLLLIVYEFFYILKYIDSYDKIEEKLKDMYEGKNLVKLEDNDVEKTFQDSVKYINDISNGFENAINENMKSERLKTELITNVSHDIKTPLTSIINYVDLLKQEKIENPKAIEYIEILESKSQRLKKLTEDLVEASKASSGAIKLKIENINIVELLNQAIGEFEDKFKQNNLEIIFEHNLPEIKVNADSRYLYRVIENLFSNISKYALEKSRVYIDINDSEKIVQLTIKNISKDKLNISADELMQRFVRGDKSRTTEGSGLGISIAKSLTEAQNGKFDLQIDGDLFKIVIVFEK